MSRTVLAAVLSVAGLAPALPATATEGRERPLSPVVVDSASRAYGRTYAQRSARRWQYMFSIPVNRNPLTDTTGRNCGVRQSGPVFFLGTTYNNPSTVSRTCTVPRGRALFFPIVNVKNDNTPPFAGPGETQGGPTPFTFEELLARARGVVDKAHDLSADLDGRPITGIDLTSGYRVSAPSFRVRPPANNLLLAGGEYARPDRPSTRSPGTASTCCSARCAAAPTCCTSTLRGRSGRLCPFRVEGE